MTRIQAKLFVGCLAMIAFCLVAMPVLLSAAESSYDLVYVTPVSWMVRAAHGIAGTWRFVEMGLRGSRHQLPSPLLASLISATS